jgi:hypothetical protein
MRIIGSSSMPGGGEGMPGIPGIPGMGGVAVPGWSKPSIIWRSWASDMLLSAGGGTRAVVWGW